MQDVLSKGDKFMNLTEGLIIGALVLVFIAMIWIQSRRRRSAMTEQASMIDKLRKGIRIKTVAGVVGHIREIREESKELTTILVETGQGDKTSFVLYDINAVLAVLDEPGANITVSNVELTEKKMSTAEDTPTPTFEEMQAQQDTDFDAKTFVSKSNKGRTKKK